jgi:hypothetical protein
MALPTFGEILLSPWDVPGALVWFHCSPSLWPVFPQLGESHEISEETGHATMEAEALDKGKQDLIWFSSRVIVASSLFRFCFNWFDNSGSYTSWKTIEQQTGTTTWMNLGVGRQDIPLERKSGFGLGYPEAQRWCTCWLPCNEFLPMEVDAMLKTMLTVIASHFGLRTG